MENNKYENLDLYLNIAKNINFDLRDDADRATMEKLIHLLGSSNDQKIKVHLTWLLFVCFHQRHSEPDDLSPLLNHLFYHYKFLQRSNKNQQKSSDSKNEYCTLNKYATNMQLTETVEVRKYGLRLENKQKIYKILKEVKIVTTESTKTKIEKPKLGRTADQGYKPNNKKNYNSSCTASNDFSSHHSFRPQIEPDVDNTPTLHSEFSRPQSNDNFTEGHQNRREQYIHGNTFASQSAPAQQNTTSDSASSILCCKMDKEQYFGPSKENQNSSKSSLQYIRQGNRSIFANKQYFDAFGSNWKHSQTRNQSYLSSGSSVFPIFQQERQQQNSPMKTFSKKLESIIESSEWYPTMPNGQKLRFAPPKLVTFLLSKQLQQESTEVKPEYKNGNNGQRKIYPLQPPPRNRFSSISFERQRKVIPFLVNKPLAPKNSSEAMFSKSTKVTNLMNQKLSKFDSYQIKKPVKLEEKETSKLESTIDSSRTSDSKANVASDSLQDSSSENQSKEVPIDLLKEPDDVSRNIKPEKSLWVKQKNLKPSPRTIIPPKPTKTSIMREQLNHDRSPVLKKRLRLGAKKKPSIIVLFRASKVRTEKRQRNLEKRRFDDATDNSDIEANPPLRQISSIEINKSEKKNRKTRQSQQPSFDFRENCGHIAFEESGEILDCSSSVRTLQGNLCKNHRDFSSLTDIPPPKLRQWRSHPTLTKHLSIITIQSFSLGGIQIVNHPHTLYVQNPVRLNDKFLESQIKSILIDATKRNDCKNSSFFLYILTRKPEQWNQPFRRILETRLPEKWQYSFGISEFDFIEENVSTPSRKRWRFQPTKRKRRRHYHPYKIAEKFKRTDSLDQFYSRLFSKSICNSQY